MINIRWFLGSYYGYKIVIKGIAPPPPPPPLFLPKKSVIFLDLSFQMISLFTLIVILLKLHTNVIRKSNFCFLQISHTVSFILKTNGGVHMRKISQKTGCLGLPRSRLYYQFLIKIFELSYEKRAGPANRDLALFSLDLGKTGCFFLI